VQLIECFYTIKSGTLTIAGHPVSSLDRKWLRRNMAYVTQDPVMFHASIADNIRYGNPNASDEQVHQAAIQANCHEFIESFPEGYATIVGERGATLSGGQRQRISIARAILRNPAILILDEATSALDNKSEKLVQAALDHVMRGRTVLVIAHRLSTIENADVIAVVRQGRIIELGTHSELLAQQGFYASLHSTDKRK
jgi:ATP-binding cassette subfamily B (MDR/TAP) protein 8